MGNLLLMWIKDDPKTTKRLLGDFKQVANALSNQQQSDGETHLLG